MNDNLRKISTAEDLDTLFEASHRDPVVIFKHSSSCGISAHVLSTISGIEPVINVIVVQEQRELSDDVARRTGRTHQSPQAFVLSNGKAVYHATHYGIDADAIVRAVRSAEETR